MNIKRNILKGILLLGSMLLISNDVYSSDTESVSSSGSRYHGFKSTKSAGGRFRKPGSGSVSSRGSSKKSRYSGFKDSGSARHKSSGRFRPRAQKEHQGFTSRLKEKYHGFKDSLAPSSALTEVDLALFEDYLSDEEKALLEADLLSDYVKAKTDAIKAQEAAHKPKSKYFGRFKARGSVSSKDQKILQEKAKKAKTVFDEIRVKVRAALVGQELRDEDKAKLEKLRELGVRSLEEQRYFDRLLEREEKAKKREEEARLALAAEVKEVLSDKIQERLLRAEILTEEEYKREKGKKEKELRKFIAYVSMQVAKDIQESLKNKSLEEIQTSLERLSLAFDSYIRELDTKDIKTGVVTDKAELRLLLVGQLNKQKDLEDYRNIIKVLKEFINDYEPKTFTRESTFIARYVKLLKHVKELVDNIRDFGKPFALGEITAEERKEELAEEERAILEEGVSPKGIKARLEYLQSSIPTEFAEDSEEGLKRILRRKLVENLLSSFSDDMSTEELAQEKNRLKDKIQELQILIQLVVSDEFKREFSDKNVREDKLVSLLADAFNQTMSEDMERFLNNTRFKGNKAKAFVERLQNFIQVLRYAVDERNISPGIDEIDD